MRIVVSAGAEACVYPKRAIPSTKEVYLRFYIKWNNGFTFSPITTKVAYIQMLGAPPQSSMVAKMTVQISPVGKPWIGFSSDPGNQVMLFPQNQGNDITVVGGQWYLFELRAKANTPGQSDGIGQLWVNGILRAAYSNLDYGWLFNINDVVWNSIWLTGYWNEGADVDKTSWYDNLVVSTS